MMERLLYKGLFLLMFTLLFAPVWAEKGDSDTKLTKSISEAYLMPKNGHLDIINKYGQVVINNADNDSVTVNIKIVAYGKDREVANKILDRVDFDFEKTKEYLGLETVLDRKSGAFKELWNSIGDYSKTLLSKNKLVINYEVNVPKSMTISIHNKFGDVFLPNRNKRVDINMSHGNLRSNEFNASSNISISYGNAEIRHINSGQIKSKASDTFIKSAGSIEVTSSSSEIEIQTIDELELNSRSDKNIALNTVKSLHGKIMFSNLEVGQLSKNIDIESSYGDIKIDRIPFSFSFVRIVGKSANIDLRFDEKTHMEIDIKAYEDDLHFPYVDLDKKPLDEKKRLARFTGTIGNKNNYKGDLNIDAQKGTVDIRLQTQQQSVKTK